MEICKICGNSGRLSCGACWNDQKTALCPDCGGTSSTTGEPCAHCLSLGRFTPPSCANSLPCLDCGAQAGEWKPGHHH